MTVLIDGTYNSRDVGGLPLAGGGTVAAGVLYRSDALAGVTPSGRATIDASPIGTVVDFRAVGERSQAPDNLPPRIDVVALPMLDGAVAEVAEEGAGVPSLEAVYAHLLSRHAEDFVAVARLVATPADASHPAVLVHCTAGKDRTGVTVALLLDAAGTAREAVIADYAATEQNLSGEWADGMRARVEAAGMPVTPELDALIGAAPRTAIESVFTRLDAAGGAAQYLRDGGLAEGDLAALRARLTSR